MGVRDQRRAERDRTLLDAAGGLFWMQGYAATTNPQIATRAGVAIGTVAKVGSKDALFLRTRNESSPEISLRLISEAAAASTVAARVWAYFGQLIETAVSMPRMLRGYLVAYLRAAEHAENVVRLQQFLQQTHAIDTWSDGHRCVLLRASCERSPEGSSGDRTHITATRSPPNPYTTLMDSTRRAGAYRYEHPGRGSLARRLSITRSTGPSCT
jgi:AcrR family transcriptional regulator